KIKPEDDQYERQGAQSVHVDASRPGERLDARQAAQRQQGSQEQSAKGRKHGQLDREYHAVLKQVDPRALDDVEIEGGHAAPSLVVEAGPKKPGTAMRRSMRPIALTTIRFRMR